MGLMDNDEAALAVTEAIARGWIERETTRLIAEGKSPAEVRAIIGATMARPDFVEHLIDVTRIAKEAFRQASDGRPQEH